MNVINNNNSNYNNRLNNKVLLGTVICPFLYVNAWTPTG